MEAVHPAIFPSTEDDHAAWVVVATITFFIYTFGAVITKLSLRYKAAGWRPNDTVLAVGLLILLVQSICVVASCTNGLGKHQDSVPSEHLDKFDRVCLFLSFELPNATKADIYWHGCLVSVCITASQHHHHSLQQILNVSPHQRHLQLRKTAYGQSCPVRPRYCMCSGSNLRRCFRMCSAHAVVDWRFVPRVCECLPVQRHHQHIDGRRPCFTADCDDMACPNESSGEAAYSGALRKSDCVSFHGPHRVPGVPGCVKSHI